jgi:hypothetical protein
MTTAKPWDAGADFYDCRDGETLQHEDLEECLSEYFDGLDGVGHHRPRGPLEERIRAAGPLEVAAYERVKMDGAKTAHWRVEGILEDLTEWANDEFGHEDHEVSTDEANEELFRALEGPVATWLGKLDPWTCEVLARREFSVEELVAFARETHPEEFEGKETK